MTVDQLLNPRYEVIADYPNSQITIGTILTLEVTDYFNYQWLDKRWTSKIENIDKYPHLFKRLPWWAYRQEAEMPKYLKLVRPDGIIYDKIEKWEMGIYFGYTDFRKRSGCGLTSFKEEYTYQPCTEEEYLLSTLKENGDNEKY